MKNSKIQYEFKERGIHIQVVFALHAACTLLVSCFLDYAVLQLKCKVEGQIRRLHDD